MKNGFEKNILNRKEMLINSIVEQQITLTEIITNIELDTHFIVDNGYLRASLSLEKLENIVGKLGNYTVIGKFVSIYYERAASEIYRRNQKELEKEEDMAFDRVIMLYACNV